MSYNFDSLEAVSQETALIISSINEADFATKALTAITNFEYQGLDVKAIIKALYTRGAEKGRTGEQIREDIWRMILLFLCRGNNLKKMLERSKAEIVGVIRGFKNNYNLVDQVGRGGSDKITLSRVAAVFPGVTLALLAHPTISPSIPRAVSLPISDFGNNFPKVMQTVIVASILPKSPVGISLMKALLLYMIEENRLLSKVRNQTNEMILDEVIKFAKASFSSNVLPFDQRTEVCERHGIIVSNAPAASTVTATSTFDRKYANIDFNFMA